MGMADSYLLMSANCEAASANPATTTPQGNSFARTQFPGNIIPASNLDPTALRFMKEIEPQLRRLLVRRTRLHPYFVEYAIETIRDRVRQLDIVRKLRLQPRVTGLEGLF